MKFISPATSLTPPENLALDEALLTAMGDATQPWGESLRIWEESVPAVIVGRSSRVADEVDVAQCQADCVPILRRSSGGCAIVAGPGCLMYSVVLDLRQRPELRVIDQAHRFVLDRILAAIHTCGQHDATREGMSDLVVPTGERTGESKKKFSGNSLRITRDGLLYHGTILLGPGLLDSGLLGAGLSQQPKSLDSEATVSPPSASSEQFDTSLIAKWLRPPPREPTYRKNRDHGNFVTTLKINRDKLVAALRSTWQATESQTTWPADQVRELVEDKYATDAWNYRH